MKNVNIKKLYFKDTSFADLMNKRIYNILLIASAYDSFMLEEDGRVDEQIFNEYVSLDLRYPPRITLVNNEEDAFRMLKERSFELIISMPAGEHSDTFDIAKRIKELCPQIPIIVLTPFSRGVSRRFAHEDLSAIDYVFSWLGNADLLLAIIKLIEDRMNVEYDVAKVGVQVILFVEDSVRFYSSMLPILYKLVFKQSRSFMTEALNEHEQMLRMRGRPKIVLARSYEEAMKLYRQYKNHLLGVITDVSFNRSGVKNKYAGISLCEDMRLEDPHIPIIMQSSDGDNAEYAEQFGAVFLNKGSKTLHRELEDAVIESFGFGDFVFKDPHTGQEVKRITMLKELQESIFTIPDDSLYYHVSRNHISRWLYSRAMFPLAEFLKRISIEPGDNLQDVRRIIFEAIVDYRRIKNRGVVALFERDRFDEYSKFARIGEGSMGGKGRGLAFLDAMVKRTIEDDDFPDASITVPRTVVLCTDLFSDFMAKNNLYEIALQDLPDDEILDHFLKAQLSNDVMEDIQAFLASISGPVAIRSSSLLEDSHYQPFAGIYATYMVPHSPENQSLTLLAVRDAIKAVYASVFYRDSKAYLKSTRNVIDEEKMAIVMQEVCGTSYGSRFYPSFSGVARSLNFYPIGHEKAEEGVAHVGLGLGKYIVEGGMNLRFSPAHPKSVLQTSTLQMTLHETQTFFYALDLHSASFTPQVDDGFNLLKLKIKDAEEDGSLLYLASTYDPQAETLYDGVYPGGRKVITFANILKHDVFPLAPILKRILQTGQREMGRAIEIEFAVNLHPKPTFYLLQIRPIVDSNEWVDEDITNVADEETLVNCYKALGQGVVNDVHDVVYVKPQDFDAEHNPLIVGEIDEINRRLLSDDKGYVLVGPGRWGSNDPWLGIPVKWPQISAARVIVESGLHHYRVDPSQGTHFFQNLTSFGVGYFTVNPYMNDGFVDFDFLDKQKAVEETQFIRHVRFECPVVIKMDGRKNRGVVLNPECKHSGSIKNQ
ncbi:PEP/pyruvate-binding domain-containing protein [Microbacter margulisiae]|uniref:CheY-like chemotaxis protein n=1 Tax=Microbacter margulisiae TaxID=1350067 RepID=A0A7W5H128_9PORP|nr:PEP/pyruvate-binding domain-containing protein [Microbacter margulisiae]MBB3185942.1 CheY-like chemotaxis protein [Microbacter margulisiae]